jgi:carboxymethylenebutenolidase
LVPHIKEVAERFAREGYVALAPDLYHGEKAEEPDEARKLAMKLDRARAVAEIEAAIVQLRLLEAVGNRDVGLVGWCMGGGLALSTAAEVDDIGAVVVFYGRPLEDEETMRIKAPVLGHYGELDAGIPVASVRAFEKEMTTHGIFCDILIYPGAGHAFFNETRDAYDPDAAMAAWNRTLEWFQKHLE